MGQRQVQRIHKIAAVMSKRISFTAHGKVQGVFFRDFTQTQANKYGITGWVKNTSDGKVQGEAQGDESSLEKLKQDLNQGPSAAQVVKLDGKRLRLKMENRASMHEVGSIRCIRSSTYS